jgi:hypothetical protein
MQFGKRTPIILAVALLSTVVSCRHAAKDPLVGIAEKYNAGNFVRLDDFYRETAGVKLPLKGVVVEVEQSGAMALLDAIRAEYVNVMPFRIEKNYGSEGKKDRVAVIKSMDQFELVDALKTSGKEDKVSNESIVKALKSIDAAAKIRINGAGADFVEFTFVDPPADWGAVANECAAIAPNIVIYGTGTVKKLESEMRQYNGAVLWWY